jgi:hypothetical protein
MSAIASWINQIFSITLANVDGVNVTIGYAIAAMLVIEVVALVWQRFADRK